MNNRAFFSCSLFVTILFFASGYVHAQQTNDEFKLKLRKSLENDLNLKPELKTTPFTIDQYDKEVLKVSPTTKLPTTFDRMQLLNPVSPEEQIKINLHVTNESQSQVNRSMIDYSKGHFIPVPNARSIAQWVQYTRGDFGGGVAMNVGDLDPVRAIQNYNARKRKEKVDRIKKAYGQE